VRPLWTAAALLLISAPAVAKPSGTVPPAGPAAAVLLVTDVGENAQSTMPAAVWRKLAGDYVAARAVTAEPGTALPDDAHCRAAHASYAVFATFDRAMRLPGLAQDTDRVYGVARFTVRNCQTGAVSPTKTVRIESDPLTDLRGPDQPLAGAVWERAVRTAFAHDPLTLGPAPVPAASAAPVARVVSIENGTVYIDNTGRFAMNQVLRAFANAGGKPYASPVELVVLDVVGRYARAGIVGRVAPRVGDYVEALPAEAK
jgi:hypothetical protein